MLTKASMLADALAYAQRGWPVFPCNPAPKSADPDKSKAPLVGRDRDENGKPIPNTGGLRKATTDEGQIREWWRKWPNALIGVPTGAAIGLWVLDFDPDGEPVEMIESRVELACGKLPLGPRSRTQSGGWHIWFRLPEGEIPKNSVRRLANVDWRAEGGYVIVPPSVMSDGKAYEWLVSPDISDFPDAPPGLLDLVFKRGRFAPERKASKPAGEFRALVDDTKVRRYCEVALQRAGANIRALVKGQMNAGINNIALGIGHLVGAGGLSRADAYKGLYDACMALGLKADDKALRAGGTLERALDDGAREPADLSHIGRYSDGTEQRNQALMERFGGGPLPDTLPDHDEVTGEVYDESAPPIGDDDGGREGDDPFYEADKLPYRCLGFQRGVYYYFSDKTQQITPLRARDHTTLNLLQLADLNFWQRALDTQAKITAEQWQQIANALMEGCHRAGIFIETHVRGRGAWIGDDGKVVVHTGDSVRIAGEIVPLNDIPGRYIYEAEPAWTFQFGAPATTKDANALADICKRLTWVDPMSGALLCGWCVIAPVCGALKWRPHVWITGPATSGKTTVIEEIVGRLVGPAAERFEGNTTEPGIRQKMGFDARPIILDEAESEDQQAVMRMQAILALARIASSGGTISKGSSSGRAMSFVARSCFCFSSINTALRHHADESRVTKLILARNESADALKHYQDLMRDINARFTPQYAGAMFSRTIRYLPELLANIETFKVAAGMAFRNRRAADQIGPMLAGFYLCHRTDRISLEDAEAFIKKHDWAEHVALESTTDEMRLFAYIMSRRVRVQVGSGSAREVSIGQAVEMTQDEHEGRYYMEALGPLGIKVTWDGVTISNNADRLKELLKETQWSSDWKRPLSMIEGAEKTEATYFAPGLISRAVKIPLSLLRGE